MIHQSRSPFDEAAHSLKKSAIAEFEIDLSEDAERWSLSARYGLGGKMKWVCLGHLSGENNDPELAADTHRSILGDRVPLLLASRYGATDVIDI